jgi:hypothetical protein
MDKKDGLTSPHERIQGAQELERTEWEFSPQVRVQGAEEYR